MLVCSRVGAQLIHGNWFVCLRLFQSKQRPRQGSSSQIEAAATSPGFSSRVRWDRGHAHNACSGSAWLFPLNWCNGFSCPQPQILIKMLGRSL